MQNENVLFDTPVVLVSGNTVKRFYVSAYATLQDNYDPLRVLKVCAHTQQTHKGQVFRYAGECDILAYELLRNLPQKGGRCEYNLCNT